MTKDPRKATAAVLIGIAVGAGALLAAHVRRTASSGPRGENISSPLPPLRSKSTDTGIRTEERRLAEARLALADGDGCALAHGNLLKSLTPAEVTRLLEGDPSVKMARIALTDPEHLGHLDSLRRKSETSDFIYALYIGGLIESKQPTNPDPAEASRRLTELANRFPQNGAIPYFQAALREKLQEPSDDVREDLMRAAEAPEFESPFLPLARRLYAWGLKDGGHYLVAMHALTLLPTPDYLATEQIALRLLDEEDERFRMAELDFGENLMKSAMESARKREGVYWLALEYRVGQEIQAKAWKKLRHGAELPEDLRTPYQDLIALDPHRKTWQKILENLPGRCEPGEIQAEVDLEAYEYREETARARAR